MEQLTKGEGMKNRETVNSLRTADNSRHISCEEWGFLNAADRAELVQNKVDFLTKEYNEMINGLKNIVPLDYGHKIFGPQTEETAVINMKKRTQDGFKKFL